MVDGYEFALKHIGIAVDSLPIWHGYVEYLKETKAESLDPNALRKVIEIQVNLIRCMLRCAFCLFMKGTMHNMQVYTRAIAVPLSQCEVMWREYESFENGLNEHLVRLLFRCSPPFRILSLVERSALLLLTYVINYFFACTVLSYLRQAKQLLEEHMPVFQTARGVCRDRVQVSEGLLPNMLAHPPGTVSCGDI